jgi:NhaP-type Na+/H+ or K+/H+ antiporter
LYAGLICLVIGTVVLGLAILVLARWWGRDAVKHSPGVEFLGDIGLVLVAALVGGLVARALRLPVLIGYLLAGLVIGPAHPRLHRQRADRPQRSRTSGCCC